MIGPAVLGTFQLWRRWLWWGERQLAMLRPPERTERHWHTCQGCPCPDHEAGL